MQIILQSVLTCPHCGFQAELTMPTDSCQFFYGCTRCGARLKAKTGDCCIFCSYGNVPCPSIQAERQAINNSQGCTAQSSTHSIE